jgi:hypothetical protein
MVKAIRKLLVDCFEQWSVLGLLFEIELELKIGLSVQVHDMELLVIHTRDHLGGIRRDPKTEFVKNAVILIIVAKLAFQRLVESDGVQGLVGHLDIPNLDSHIVSDDDLAAIQGALDIRDRRNDFCEKVVGLGRLGFRKRLTIGVADTVLSNVYHFH